MLKIARLFSSPSRDDVPRSSGLSEAQKMHQELHGRSLHIPEGGDAASRLSPGSATGNKPDAHQLVGHHINKRMIVMTAPHGGKQQMVNCARMLIDKKVGLIIDMSEDRRPHGALHGGYVGTDLDTADFSREAIEHPALHLPGAAVQSTMTITTTGSDGAENQLDGITHVRIAGAKGGQPDVQTLKELANGCKLARLRDAERPIVLMCNDHRGLSARLVIADLLIQLRDKGLLYPDQVSAQLGHAVMVIRKQCGRHVLESKDLALLLEMGRDIASRQPSQQVR